MADKKQASTGRRGRTRKPENEFSKATKDLLAQRAGYKCSNPRCPKPTAGPAVQENKTVNIGKAAHITAAAEGGPRYDASLSPEERSSSSNGIWLCSNCADLVDRDVIAYPESLLKNWKVLAEKAAKAALEGELSGRDLAYDDRQLLLFYRTCFDRPAYMDRFRQECSTQAMDKAIEDTITAINTGCLRARDGTILQSLAGKSFLQRDDWRHQLDEVVSLLRVIRGKYREGLESGEIHHGAESGDGRVLYCINNREIVDWFDNARGEVVEKVSALLLSAGLPPLRNRYL